MKIAYLIISHKSPEQVYNLIKILNNEKNHFFIHFKKGLEFEIPNDIKKLPNVYFTEKRYKAGWAGFKILLATIELIKLAKRTKCNFHYYVNLSESCYPLSNNEKIENFLENTNSNFIEGTELAKIKQKG